VEQLPFAPELPCPFHPGSAEKILVLEARALARLPLFVPGDAQGARRLEALRVGLCHVPLRFHREELLLDHLDGQPQTVRQLALAANLSLSSVRVTLMLLKEAGTIELCPKGGWRLAPLLPGELVDDKAAHRNGSG
jgi:hypothetical protein